MSIGSCFEGAGWECAIVMNCAIVMSRALIIECSGCSAAVC